MNPFFQPHYPPFVLFALPDPEILLKYGKMGMKLLCMLKKEAQKKGLEHRNVIVRAISKK